jgi:hypothetical protein
MNYQVSANWLMIVVENNAGLSTSLWRLHRERGIYSHRLNAKTQSEPRPPARSDS